MDSGMRCAVTRDVCSLFGVLAGGALAQSLYVGQKVIHVARVELLSMARRQDSVAMRWR
jgi:hypothetical protein